MNRRQIKRREARRRHPCGERLEGRAMLDGALDPSFGQGGVSLVPFDLVGGGEDRAKAVAIQSDGKIVLAGYARRGPTNDDFAVLRLNPDGTPDPGFGGGGRVVIPFDRGGGDDDRAGAVAIQPDGKIIIAGDSESARGGADFAAARLDPDGTLDPGFGVGGKAVVAFDLGRGDNDRASAMALQSDGKIVLVGQADVATADLTDFALARLEPDGTPDPNFGIGGKVTTDFGRGADAAAAVAIGRDGQVVVGGQTAGPSTADSDFALARYHSDGTPDQDFGTGGRVVAGTVLTDRLAAVAVRPDGRVVAVGDDFDDVLLMQFTADGRPDAGFASKGRVIVDVGGDSADDYPEAMVLQPDGKMVVAGATRRGMDDDLSVVRFKPDGTLDAGFGTGGKVFVNLGGADQEAAAVALQRDGDIVAAGTALRPGPAAINYDFLAARLLVAPPVVTIAAPSTPALDPAFDTGTKGDGRTTNTAPRLIGTAGPFQLVQVFEAGGFQPVLLGSSYADGNGSYAVVPSRSLASGTYPLFARASDGFGHQGPPSGALTLTVLPPDISPTLIVTAAGQTFDSSALGNFAIQAFLSAAASIIGLGPLVQAGLFTYDLTGGLNFNGIVNSKNPGGNGRSYDGWQDVIQTDGAGTVTGLFRDEAGDQRVALRYLSVDWDTYGTTHDPAQDVARRVDQIVADTSYDGRPWDVLFIGYSRGGPFINELMKGLDLANNPRIDYSEAILLDPTASTFSGDRFPGAMPPGLDREIVYDDGYAFPLTQLGFINPFNGQVAFHHPLWTIDGNSGARVAGAEYRYVRPEIADYLGSHSGVTPVDSARSHMAVPDWYIDGLAPTAPILADIREFLAAKDHGARGGGTDANLVVRSEAIAPPSTAPNLHDPAGDIARQLLRVARELVDSAERLAEQLAREAKRLIQDVARQANQLGRQLIAGALRAGGEVLAEARRQASRVYRAARAEIRHLQAEARREAHQLMRQGKLFGKEAAREVSHAAHQLAAVQKRTKQVVSRAERQANRAVAAVRKRVDAAKRRAEELARAALARLDAARRQAAAIAAHAAGQLAAAYGQAADAARKEAGHLADQAGKIGGRISSGVRGIKKKWHL